MTAINNMDYYCDTYKKGYTHRDWHSCPDKCLACYKYFPKGDTCSTLKDVKTLQCNKCNWIFFGQTCFANHLDIRGKKGPSVCNTVFKCLKCDELFNRTDIAPEDHVFGMTKCGNCKHG